MPTLVFCMELDSKLSLRLERWTSPNPWRTLSGVGQNHFTLVDVFMGAVPLSPARLLSRCCVQSERR